MAEVRREIWWSTMSSTRHFGLPEAMVDWRIELRRHVSRNLHDLELQQQPDAPIWQHSGQWLHLRLLCLLRCSALLHRHRDPNSRPRATHLHLLRSLGLRQLHQADTFIQTVDWLLWAHAEICPNSYRRLTWWEACHSLMMKIGELSHCLCWRLRASTGFPYLLLTDLRSGFQCFPGLMNGTLER